MIRSEAKNILLKEFNTNFSSTTPVSYTNYSEFFYTTGVKTTKPTNDTWVRFLIENNFSSQVSIGKEGLRNFNRLGLISYQVFTPSNKGTYSGEIVCEEINDIFEGKRISGVICETGTYQEIGIQGDDLYQMNGNIPWWYYEKK